MRIHKSIIRVFDNQRGAVAIITAVVTLFVILGVAALAIDIGRVAAAKNELQNAADGGALAGTDKLYLHSADNSPVPNTQANIEEAAWAVAIQNYHTGSLLNSDIDVERGHWRFGVNGGFSPFTGGNGVRLLDPSELFDYIIKLNENEAHHEVLNKFDGKTQFKGEYPFFINAVRVSIGDGSTPTLTNIFRKSDSAISASAVAYIGPAGGWQPGDFDAPVAICEESLANVDFCHIARMMEDNTAGDTAQWTDFSTPCSGGASANTIEDRLSTCGAANPNILPAGIKIGVTNGVADSVFDHNNKASLSGCWRSLAEEGTLLQCDSSHQNNPTNPTNPWSITVPVVKCSEGNTCNTLVGAISVDLLWIVRDDDPDAVAPCEMGDWSYGQDDCGDLMQIIADGGTIQDAVNHLKLDDPELWDKIDANRWGQGHHAYTVGMARWDCFAREFNIKDPSGNPAHFAKKTVYFAPNCETIEVGNPGVGVEFFGVLSENSVLVK